MGGLSAAIHARLAGADVLVLEQREIVGGKAAGMEQAGYRLDPGPSIVILTRLYADLFRRAGRNPEDYLRFRRLDPFSRVVSSQRVVDLPADRDACLKLVGEIAPEDAEAFTRLMGTLDKVQPHIDRSIFSRPYHRPWQLLDPQLIATARHFDVRVTYKELVDRMFRSPLLRAFFYGFPSYGGQTYDSKAAGALLIPYLMIQEGVYYPEGGVAAIPAALERLARELGVEIRTGARVTGLVQSGSRIEAVELEGGERVKAERFISNRDRLSTRAWLGRKVDWRPSLSYFTIHWGVRRRIPGLSHHTLVIPDGFEAGFEALYRHAQFPTPPIVYLNDTTDSDSSVAPPGCTNLFAVVTVPAREDHLDWRANAPAHVAAVRELLKRNGCGFEDDEVEFERVQTPLTFEERDGSYRGSLYGPHEMHRVFGLFPLRCEDEEFKNLFYCGGSVQPGAGLPMVTLSGRFAAELATR